ncbi:unnamed protein product, partial [marine sediment metagenome]
MLRRELMVAVLIIASFTATASARLPFELLQSGNQSSSVDIQPVRVDNKPGIAVIFTGTDDLHYYASAKKETASPGYHLTITTNAE